MAADEGGRPTSLPDFDKLWDYQHPDRTENAFRELLPGAEQNPDRSYHLQLLTQIARAQGLQRNFAQANETLDTVEAQLASSQLVLPHIRNLLERGRVLRSSGHPEQASPCFEQAWELASTHGEDFYAVDAAHMLAMVTSSQEQINWNLKALHCAETSKDERARGWCGSLYNNLGWTYHDDGEYERALDLFDKALRFRQTQGKAREIRIAKWSVSRTLRSLQRTGEALALQQDLLADWEKSGEQEQGYVSEEIAECLLSLGRTSESRPHFAQAYSLLMKDPWLVSQENDRLQRLKRLGEQ